MKNKEIKTWRLTHVEEKPDYKQSIEEARIMRNEWYMFIAVVVILSILSR